MSADFGSRCSSITTRSNDFYNFVEDYNHNYSQSNDNSVCNLLELSLSKILNISYNWCYTYDNKSNYDLPAQQRASPIALALAWVAAMENGEAGMADREQFFEKILNKKFELKTPLNFSQPNVLKTWMISLSIGHVTSVKCIETSSKELIESYLESIENGSKDSNIFVVNCEDPIMAIGKGIYNNEMGQFGLECCLMEKKGNLNPGIYFFKNKSEISKSLICGGKKAKLWVLQFPGRTTYVMCSNLSSASEISHCSNFCKNPVAFDPKRDAKLAYLALKRAQRITNQVRIISPH